MLSVGIDLGRQYVLVHSVKLHLLERHKDFIVAQRPPEGINVLSGFFFTPWRLETMSMPTWIFQMQVMVTLTTPG